MEMNWRKRGVRTMAALLTMALLCIGANVFALAAGVSAQAAERAVELDISKGNINIRGDKYAQRPDKESFNEHLISNPGGKYIIKGSSNQYDILIESGSNITVQFSDLSVQPLANQETERQGRVPLTILNSKVNIILSGSNVLKGSCMYTSDGEYTARNGMHIENNSEVTISGSGSLSVYGGDSARQNSSLISGGDGLYLVESSLTVNGGEIAFQGGNQNAASSSNAIGDGIAMRRKGQLTVNGGSLTVDGQSGVSSNFVNNNTYGPFGITVNGGEFSATGLQYNGVLDMHTVSLTGGTSNITAKKNGMAGVSGANIPNGSQLLIGGGSTSAALKGTNKVKTTIRPQSGWYGKRTQGGSESYYFSETTISSNLGAGTSFSFMKNDKEYTVTLDAGTGASGAGSYLPGTRVTVSAGKKTGHQFGGWTVSSGTVSLADASAQSTTFVMPASAVALAARWNPLYKVTVTDGTKSPDQAAGYLSGSKVTLTAADKLSEKKFFDHWELVSGDGSFGDVKSATTVFTVGSKDAAIRAVYEQGYSVTAEYGLAEAGPFHSGEKITITAEDRKDESLLFDHWELVSGDGAFQDASLETTVFTVGSKDAVVRAVYVQGYRLTVENGTGSGLYRAGETVPLKALLSDSEEFVTWSYVGTEGKIENPLALSTNFIMGGEDAEVTVISISVADTGDFVVTGGEYGTDYSYNGGTLTITGSGSYTVAMRDGVKSTKDRIIVSSGSPVLTLSGLNIVTEGNGGSPLEIGGGAGRVTLVLQGTNTLEGNSVDRNPGVWKRNSEMLTITSIQGDGSTAGTLIAKGGSVSAGIGGSETESVSNITINGGTVLASSEGQNSYGAGIGGGHLGGNGSHITINGGSVTAKSYNGAGIGGGGSRNNTYTTGSGLDIVINGGEVKAQSTNMSRWGIPGMGIGRGGASSNNISLGTAGITVNGAAEIKQGDNSASDKVDASAIKEGTKRFVSITYPSSITNLTLTPSAGEVYTGGSLAFRAELEGSGDKTVRWELTGNQSSGTVLAPNGTLSVAEDETATTLTVKATSVQNSSCTDSAAVQVKTVEVTLQVSKPEIVTGSSMTVTAGTPNDIDGTVRIYLDGRPVSGSMKPRNGSLSFTIIPGLLPVGDHTVYAVFTGADASGNNVSKASEKMPFTVRELTYEEKAECPSDRNPIGGSVNDQFGTDTFGFIGKSGIAYEYSLDGGSTWKDVDASSLQADGTNPSKVRGTIAVGNIALAAGMVQVRATVTDLYKDGTPLKNELPFTVTLEGSASLSGQAVYKETLTSSVEGAQEDAALVYSFYRKDGSEETLQQTGIENTYTLQAEDIGAVIFVKVTAEGYVGELTAETENAVQKAAQTLTVDQTSYEKICGDADFSLQCTTDGDGTILYEADNPRIVTVSEDGTVSVRGAGTAVVTVTLSDGTCFAGTDKKEITITVSKKAAPVISPVEKSYVYSKGSAAETVDLTSGLPQDRGATTYTLAGDYETGLVENASVDADGTLSYRIKPQAALGSGTTLKVTVESEQYADTVAVVKISLIDRYATAQRAGFEAAVTGTASLVYGAPLGSLALNTDEAGFTATDGSEEVAGTLAWTKPDLILAAGTAQAEWTFTPDDPAMYTGCTGELTVTVSRAEPRASAQVEETDIVYHSAKTLGNYTLDGAASWTVGGTETNVDGTWSWKTPDEVPTAGNSGFTAVFTPVDSANYSTVERTVELSVAQAEPYIKAMPSAESIITGQKVSEAVLSGGAVQYSETDNTPVSGSFSWSSGDAAKVPALQDSQTTAYTVIFTPDDAVNYKETSAALTIEVREPDLAGSVSVAGQAVYGETLTASVEGVQEGAALVYSFYRLDSTGVETPLQTGSGNAYTLQAEDIGAKICVRVTASGYVGVLSAETSGAVQKAAQTLSIAQTSYNKLYGDGNFLLECTTNGDGAIRYASDNEQAVTVSEDGTVSVKGAGTAVITVTLSEGNCYAGTDEKKITITVGRAEPYIKAMPSAGSIISGQKVGDAALSGGAVQYSETDGTPVSGSFSWSSGDAAKVPTLQDSRKTTYTVIFTPDDTVNYKEIGAALTIEVKEPPKPEETEKPGETENPGTTPNPGETENPGTTPNPGETENPGTTPNPGETENPGTTPNPGETENPGTTPNPGETENPGTTPNPGGTENPGTTPNPGETEVPDESGLTGNQIVVRDDLPFLLLTGERKGSDRVRLTWERVKGCSGYDVYWTYCGWGRTYQKEKTVKAGGKHSITYKKLKKNQTCKFYVAAYKMIDGKKVYVAKSPTIHVAMGQSKYTNVKNVTVNKTKLTLKKGKTFRIRAKAVAENRRKKLLSHADKFRYYTSDKRVATVTEKGKIKAKKKGVCTIYVVANNGVTKKIKVTVK